jgi:hypothetical protein
MTISVTAMSWLIGIATVITALAPIVLIIFWLKDWVKGHLW